MKLLATIAVLITVSTNAHAFYKWVTPENITGQAKMKCDSVDIHRRFNDLRNVINCGLYLNPKQQAFYVKNIQGQNMANAWRWGNHSVSGNPVALELIKSFITSPCMEIPLDIPIKPIELSGRYSLSRMPRIPRPKRTLNIPQRSKPKQVSKPTNAPKPNTNTYSHYK